MFWSLLAVFEVVWIVGLAVWIVLERRSPAATLAWIFGLALLPLVGIPVYFLLGPRKWNRKARHLSEARRLATAALGDRLREESLSVLDDLPPERRSLVTQGLGAGGIPAGRVRDLEVYFEGEPCYAALEEAIAGARHHVHLEYYIWEPDVIGTRLRDLLVKRAREGVEVRLILDALGSSAVGGRFLRPLREAGVETAWFNRVRMRKLRPPLVNFRTHRKIAVIDGRIGFTGGMNVADVHSSEVHGETAWRDTHLRLTGSVVRYLQIVFLETWHFVSRCEPFGRDHIDLEDSGGDTIVQIVTAGPDNDAHPIHELFFTALAGARERIELTTPYFVPDEPILVALRTAALRGVDVRLLLPERSDSALVGAASRSYWEELIRAGVRIHLYRPRMLHAKTLVVDGDLSVVGSANMDNRSFRLNFELVALVHGESTASKLSEQFARDLDESRRVPLEACLDRPFVPRFAEAAARLLSPLL